MINSNLEQHKYTKTILEQLDHLKADVHEKLEKLLIAKLSFDRVFKGIPLPNKKSITSRKQKENKRKVGQERKSNKKKSKKK